MIENPPSFVARTEIYKACFDNGFRVEAGSEAGWLHYRSTTAHGDIWLAASGPAGPWFLSLGSLPVAAEMGLPKVPEPHGPGVATYAFANTSELHAALDRAYRLGVSLPDAPLREFQIKTASAPRSTEAERLVVQRIGQDVFRKALMDYWGSRCPLTGITEPALLRASHIVPWAECDSDALRLDVHNGLLLSALWDAAFDAGLVSFDDDGQVLRAPALSDVAANRLALDSVRPLRLTDAHRANLQRHRQRWGVGSI